MTENSLYGVDPAYTEIFNSIADNEYVRYERGRSKDRGEVYSLAYAAYHGINYFCSKEIMADLISEDIAVLSDIDIITFDIILLNAFVYHAQHHNSSVMKGLKALYENQCADVIKRHKLPATLREYIEAVKDYFQIIHQKVLIHLFQGFFWGPESWIPGWTVMKEPCFFRAGFVVSIRQAASVHLPLCPS